MTAGLAERLAALEARLARLEARVAATCAAGGDPSAAAAAAAAHAAAAAKDDPSVSPTQRRLADALYLPPRNYRAPFSFARVAPEYYSWPLERRAAALGADTAQRLCKTIVMANTRASAAVVPEGSASEDPTATRLFFVVTQYCRRLHAGKLNAALCRLYAEEGKPMAKTCFNMRLCAEEESLRLTGHGHNAVTPVGSHTPLCVVMSHHLLELPPGGGGGRGGEKQQQQEQVGAGPGDRIGEWGVGPGQEHGGGGWFWMGGGEVDLKLRVCAREFARAYGAVVVDCTCDELLAAGEQPGED